MQLASLSLLLLPKGVVTASFTTASTATIIIVLDIIDGLASFLMRVHLYFEVGLLNEFLTSFTDLLLAQILPMLFTVTRRK